MGWQWKFLGFELRREIRSQHKYLDGHRREILRGTAGNTHTDATGDDPDTYSKPNRHSHRHADSDGCTFADGRRHGYTNSNAYWDS